MLQDKGYCAVSSTKVPGSSVSKAEWNLIAASAPFFIPSIQSIEYYTLQCSLCHLIAFQVLPSELRVQHDDDEQHENCDYTRG